jgi:hypothetical protein
MIATDPEQADGAIPVFGYFARNISAHFDVLFDAGGLYD